MKSFVVRLSLGIVVPLLLSLLFVKLLPKEKTAMAIYEVFGVKIEKNPPQSKLTELGVTTWSKWEGGRMKIPWSFEAEETMYLLEGKVKVTVEGSGGTFEIGAGDLVVFPKGMNITWEVIEAVKKHYSLKKYLYKREKSAMATTYEVFGVKIEKNPPQSKLTELGVTTWTKWEGHAKVKWTFEGEETMYIVEGKVKITVEGSDDSFEIGAGDLAVFPKGMNITWEGIEYVKKYYNLIK